MRSQNILTTDHFEGLALFPGSTAQRFLHFGKKCKNRWAVEPGNEAMKAYTRQQTFTRRWKAAQLQIRYRATKNDSIIILQGLSRLASRIHAYEVSSIPTRISHQKYH